MKIRVAYSELRTDGNYCNRRAEAEIETEVSGDYNAAFQRAWEIVEREVKKQLANKEDLPF